MTELIVDVEIERNEAVRELRQLIGDEKSSKKLA